MIMSNIDPVNLVVTEFLCSKFVELLATTNNNLSNDVKVPRFSKLVFGWRISAAQFHICLLIMQPEVQCIPLITTNKTRKPGHYNLLLL